MKAILKSFESSDIRVPLSDYSPENPDNFGFQARIIVGEETIGGEESFDFVICTPSWLMSRYQKSDIVVGRHLLIVFEYDYSRILSLLRSTVERATGESWEEIAEKLSRLGYWEFEDFHE